MKALLGHSRSPEEGQRVDLPPLERSRLGYHYDLLRSIAAHFGRDRVDLEALHQILAPQRGGEVLAIAHGIAGRSVLGIPTSVFEEDEAVKRWHSELRRGGTSDHELRALQERQSHLSGFGRGLKIEFFDRSITAVEMQEMIRAHRLGLVSLDWREITSDPQFRERTRMLSPAHALPEISPGKEPLFYPVVPLVGYTNRGEGMLVHTHIQPFIEIPTGLFEAARQSIRSERTVVFFAAEQLSEEPLRTPRYHWALPGAFTGTVLIRPEELAPAPAPQLEELTRGIKLAIATGRPANDNFHFVFPHFLKAASLFLAKDDPSGSDIRTLEDHIISESERLTSRSSGSQYFAVRDNFRYGLRSGIETGPELQRAIRNAERNLEEDRAPREGTQSGAALVPVSELAGSRVQVLEFFKQVVTRAFEGRSSSQGLDDVSREIVFVTKAALQGVKNFEAGAALVESISPAQRVIGQLKRFSGFDEEHSKERERLQRLEYEHALCPRIMLAAAPHGEKDERPPPENNLASGSDDKALWDHAILGFTGKGLVVGRYWYDDKLGSLKLSYSTSLAEMISSAINTAQGKSEPGDKYNTEQLCSAIARFPLGRKEIDRIESVFTGKHGLEEYLGNNRNWVGEQCLANKSWIRPDREHEPGYAKAIAYLRDLHEVLLKGGDSGKRVVFDPGVAPIAMSSMLANSQAEGLLVTIIRGAVEEGSALKDFVYRVKGKVSAAQQYELLKRHESLENADRYLQVLPDGGLKLTDIGVRYVLDLIDPAYPYHHTFDDSREFLQKQHESRRNRY